MLWWLLCWLARTRTLDTTAAQARAVRYAVPWEKLRLVNDLDTPTRMRMLRKQFHAHFGGRYTERRTCALLGHSHLELRYFLDRYVPNERCMRDVLIGLYNVKVYPTVDVGAAQFRVGRSTYHDAAVWLPQVVGAAMREISLDNRLSAHVETAGINAFQALTTDGTDANCTKPGIAAHVLDPRAAKKHYTFKNRKFAYRYVTLVNLENGHLCYVSRGDPASASELTITRRDGFKGMLAPGEKISADGVYKCKTEPHFAVPERRAKRRRLPNGRMPPHVELSREARARNYQRARRQVVVENVNGRFKQYNIMRMFRGRREDHPMYARFVFELVQMKNFFRPIRRMVRPGNYAAVFCAPRSVPPQRRPSTPPPDSSDDSSDSSRSGSGSDSDATGGEARGDRLARTINVALERRAARRWERGCCARGGQEGQGARAVRRARC